MNEQIDQAAEMAGCPFCGGRVTPWETDFGVVSVVECKGCQTRFVFPWNRKGAELFEFWNKRTAPARKENRTP